MSVSNHAGDRAWTIILKTFQSKIYNNLDKEHFSIFISSFSYFFVYWETSDFYYVIFTHAIYYNRYDSVKGLCNSIKSFIFTSTLNLHSSLVVDDFDISWGVFTFLGEFFTFLGESFYLFQDISLSFIHCIFYWNGTRRGTLSSTPCTAWGTEDQTPLRKDQRKIFRNRKEKQSNLAIDTNAEERRNKAVLSAAEVYRTLKSSVFFLPGPMCT